MPFSSSAPLIVISVSLKPNTTKPSMTSSDSTLGGGSNSSGKGKASGGGKSSSSGSSSGGSPFSGSSPISGKSPGPGKSPPKPVDVSVTVTRPGSTWSSRFCLISSSKVLGTGLSSSSSSNPKSTMPPGGGPNSPGNPEFPETVRLASPAGKSSGISSRMSLSIVRPFLAVLQCGTSTIVTGRVSPGITSVGVSTSSISAEAICGLSVIATDTAFNVALPALF